MIYQWIDILGTISFAISGTLIAMQKRLDVFGILIIAFVTAIGGGTIRDVLIGNLPVSWLLGIRTTLLIILGCALAIIFRNVFSKLSRTLFLFDTMGIGLFTILGIEKALAAGIHPILCVALGTVSACFGGVTRDILCNEIPIIFRKEIYATACIIGGIVYFLLLQIPNINNDYVVVFAISSVIIIRLYAVIFDKSLPSIYK